jgi:SAM-dependent methyltransferase
MDVLRFAVPWDAAVATVGAEVEGIGRRVVVPFAGDSEAGFDESDAAAVARLESLRAEGCEYLIVSASADRWLEGLPGLGQHLDDHYRLVVREQGMCTVYALHPTGDAMGADGLPLPPTHLIRLTTGIFRRAMKPNVLQERYEAGGAKGAAWIRTMLGRNGVEMDGLRALLDFGCGCGRVLRHWKDLPARVHGTDYNPHLVRWCEEHLTFGTFATNSLEPALPFADRSFDLVYAISIFTHLDEPLQRPWISELGRIVRPGGLVLITVSGERRLRSIPAWERLREPFEAGELVVTKPDRVGTNACAVFHPFSYLRDTLATGFEMIDYVSGGAIDVNQDAVLLRTPEA